MKTVTAAIIIKDDRVLIAQRADPPKLAGFWEFPGGKVEEGETVEECLVREIQEELSIDVAVLSWYGQSIYKYESGAIDLQAFTCKIVSGSITNNTHAEIRWCRAQELSDWSFLPADIPLVKRLISEGLPATC